MTGFARAVPLDGLPVGEGFAYYLSDAGRVGAQAICSVERVRSPTTVLAGVVGATASSVANIAVGAALGVTITGHQNGRPRHPLASSPF